MNFGLSFGMGAKKFRDVAERDYGVRMTLAEAREAKHKLLAAYPAIGRWHQRERPERSGRLRDLHPAGAPAGGGARLQREALVHRAPQRPGAGYRCGYPQAGPRRALGGPRSTHVPSRF